MKVALSWLADLVDLPASREELVDVLERAGLTVEGIEERGAAIDGVVVARILTSEPHPNADRLSVCRVDDGSGEPRQIVCGAKNYRVGDLVPLALPGAVLPGDFKIKVGKLRGVESEGMMCSAKELRLAEDAEGLLILDPAATVGQPIGELFPPEVIFELEVTPNRPDCLGHLGVAREIAAFTGAAFHPPQTEDPVHSPGALVRIEDPAICPFYTARKISGVKVGPSPQWLRQRLEAAGLRPINSVVDVTNYVMMETGHPLHAFDAAKVSGPIVVRAAAGGESFAALDGQTYRLPEGVPLITAGDDLLAMAGVMGGAESGVTGSTCDVILESAVFAPGRIRAAVRAVGLQTDSSYRFERGTTPQGALLASARASALLAELASGELGETVSAGLPPEARPAVPLRIERCASVLGVDLGAEKIAGALGLLAISPVGPELWQPPFFRTDLEREVDLIEEVARVHGIEAIPARVIAAPSRASETDATYDLLSQIRSALVAGGFCEARSGVLLSRESAARGGSPESAWCVLRNPLGEDQAVMRPSLLPGLLQAISHNLHGGTRSIRLFEIGKTYRSDEPEESLTLALAITGPVGETGWLDPIPREMDFYDLTAALEAALGRDLEIQAGEACPPFALRATVSNATHPLGSTGQIAPAIARDLDARSPIFAAEIGLENLRFDPRAEPRFKPLPAFPGTSRDIAILAPVDLPYAQIAEALRDANESLLAGFFPFDLFRDPEGIRLPTGRKSLAISLTFRSPDRTLTTEEINDATGRLKERLKSRLGVDFRE